MVSLQVIGPMKVTVDGVAIRLPPRSRQQRLLCYLLLNHGQDLDRSVVAGTLWPDQDEAAARRRLSDALYLLKKNLPKKVLHSKSHTLGLHLGQKDDCDLLALQAGKPGHTLAPLDVGQLFLELEDDWVLAAREDLRRTYLKLLMETGEASMRRNQPDQALPFFSQLVDMEPLGEKGIRALMLALKQDTREAEALAVFQTFSQALEREMGSKPGEDTLALAATLEQAVGKNFGDQVLAGELPLIGRVVEHKKLCGFLDGALAGRGALVLIEGEPGIGKSRLLQELVKDARWRSLQVGQGRPRHGQLLAPALESLLTPLKAEHVQSSFSPIWLQRLLLCLPQAAHLFPDITLEPGELDPEVQGETLRRLLLCLSELGPMALVLEDMHDASADTLAQLKFLAPHLTECKILIAVSYRPGPLRDNPESWQEVQALDSKTVAHRMEIQPLTGAAVGDLLKSALGPSEENTIATLFRMSAGNPLVLLEQASALLEQGQLLKEDQGWHLKSGAAEKLVSGPAKTAIRLRLNGLSETCLSLLTFSAVDSEAMGFALLRTLSGLSQSRVVDASRLLLQRRLWREEGRGFTPAHNLIGEAIMEGLSQSERSTLHGQFLEALDAKSETAQRLGHHAFEAGLWGQAAKALAVASQNLRRQGQYHSARDQTQRALQAMEKGAKSEQQSPILKLLFEHQRLCAWTGRLKQQEEDLKKLTQLVEKAPEEAPLVFWARAEWLLSRGQLEDAMTLVQEGIQDAHIKKHPLAHAHLHHLGAKAAQATGDKTVFQKHLSQAEDLAISNGFVEVQLAAALLRAVHHHYSGELSLARDEYMEVQGLAESHGLVLQSIAALANQGAVEQGLGNEMAAIRIFEKSIERYRTYAVRDPKDLDNLSFLYFFVGNVASARRTLEEARQLWLQKSDQGGLAYNTFLAGWMELELNALGQAKPLLEKALSLGRKVNFRQAIATAQLSLGTLAMEQGRLEQAGKLLQRTQDEFDELGVSFYNGFVWAMGALNAARCGQQETAQSSYEKATEAVDSTLQASRARYLLGLTAEALGHKKQAKSWFQSAEKMLMEKAKNLPDSARKQFLALPRNEALVLAVRRFAELKKVVSLAYSGAPTGRPLFPYEKVLVWWPGGKDLKKEGFPERMDQVLQLFRLAQVQGASLTETDLAEGLGVSQATISRDLHKLREQGHILPTRGS